MNRLQLLTEGQITLIDRDDVHTFGGRDICDLSATVRVHDDRFFRSIALGGQMGAAEAFIQGYWSCDDLVSLIRIFSRSADTLSELEKGSAILSRITQRVMHLLRANSLSGSRKNIAAHYDLSNDFFQRFLDESMTYSSGYFDSPDATLSEAQTAKYDRICRKLNLSPLDHLLEIGTGWGGFAIHAAKNYGCRVTTTTISREQHDYARERIEREQPGDRINLLLEDYRHLTGQYDKLVSIEMIEAVGHEFLPTYFRACSDLLKPTGLMALQAITIADQYYDAYRKSVDFIQRYIFPGGCLPSIAKICQTTSVETDLQLVHSEDFGEHYARTLAEWRRRFFAEEAAIRELGFDDEFLRTWDYYFGYCEGGFRERRIGVSQLIMSKPKWRGAVDGSVV